MNEELDITNPPNPISNDGQVDIGSMDDETRHALYEEWKKQARECTPDNVGEFIGKLVNGHCHNYNSIATALAVAALAGAWAVEHSKQGGLTGFQWGFASHLAVAMMNYESSRLGIRIQNMDNLMYPQYAENFASVKVGREFAEKLREEAKRRLETSTDACNAVRAWWTLLANGDFPTWLQVKE